MASRATRSANRDFQTGEPSSKRKVLDDLDEESDEDAPQRKLQHTDSSSEPPFIPPASLFSAATHAFPPRLQEDRVKTQVHRWTG
jgi:hypothetical protein